MTDLRVPASSSTPASTRKAAVVTSIVAIVLGLAEAGFGAYCWYLTDIDPSDDPLVAVGYVLAIVVAAPGVVGLLLGGLGWLLADRTAGLVLAILAAVVVALPVLVVAPFSLPGF
ncbi:MULTISPECIES: hypothetical protein [unclassified Nocardioides]|jgi:hypothetical protein|uniref:hypothetical protein n=1 Tax=unclassified Nocardioides TaxID=2615069 RepID=UPI000703B852|nr:MULTISPECIES: hypothetical protein [unclassified Nocardioides]KRC46330.1 hypothetical protein ASE19_21060 [Nocardioides sp. Root79]KRC69677.1 hypothetical protein ASE20_13920 [Nocardioides sp. Root240]